MKVSRPVTVLNNIMNKNEWIRTNRQQGGVWVLILVLVWFGDGWALVKGVPRTCPKTAVFCLPGTETLVSLLRVCRPTMQQILLGNQSTC